jgi:hypothetical protein
MTDTTTSAVRAATRLIGAAEELMAAAPNPRVAAELIGDLALAAKELRANHLDDALAHVEYRGGWYADNRPAGLVGWSGTFSATVDSDGEPWAPEPDDTPPPTPADVPVRSPDRAKDRRMEAAVDEVVAGGPDPEALRARVHGDDDA